MDVSAQSTSAARESVSTKHNIVDVVDASDFQELIKDIKVNNV